MRRFRPRGARPCPGCACAWPARKRRMQKAAASACTTAAAAKTVSCAEHRGSHRSQRAHDSSAASQHRLTAHVSAFVELFEFDGICYFEAALDCGHRPSKCHAKRFCATAVRPPCWCRRRAVSYRVREAVARRLQAPAGQVASLPVDPAGGRSREAARRCHPLRSGGPAWCRHGWLARR